MMDKIYIMGIYYKYVTAPSDHEIVIYSYVINPYDQLWHNKYYTMYRLKIT